jgi:hypothetical protein
MCLSWDLYNNDSEDVQKLVDHLLDWTKRSPLESVATIVEGYAPLLADDIFDTYDKFLSLLNDKKSGASLRN